MRRETKESEETGDFEKEESEERSDFIDYIEFTYKDKNILWELLFQNLIHYLLKIIFLSGFFLDVPT
jgi:hypothetical protein